jgi:hypothetical protein
MTKKKLKKKKKKQEEEEKKEEVDDRREHLLAQLIKGKLLIIISLVCLQCTNLDQNCTHNRGLAPVAVPAPRTKTKLIIETEVPSRNLGPVE